MSIFDIDQLRKHFIHKFVLSRTLKTNQVRLQIKNISVFLKASKDYCLSDRRWMDGLSIVIKGCGSENTEFLNHVHLSIWLL